MAVKPVVDIELCDACEECVAVCPLDIFVLVHGKARPVNTPEDCIDCDACLAGCTTDAITIVECED